MMKLLSPLSPDELAHCRRTAALSKLLAERAGCSASEVRTITQSALVHDIGKSYLPKDILYKRKPLTARDWAVIRSHTTLGAQILFHTSDAMNTAAIVALQHHERLDGSGYLGLRGTAIHPHARLIAVADVFDALATRRPYKAPWPLPKICVYLSERAGIEFDTDLVALLLSNIDLAADFYSDTETYSEQNTYFPHQYAH